MQLLVSVADASEARAALAGGADVIDAKDPRRGALGSVRPDVLAAIRSTVGARRPVSAALGDTGSAADVGRLARAAAGLGVTFVKVGCRGVETVARAGRLAAAARRAAGEGVRVVLVAYADWRRAASLAPERVAAAAAERGAAGVLLDTAFKEAGLFELLTRDAIGDWVAQAHAAGLFACLAGSLRGGDFATVRALGADFVGVRGAACVGGEGGGRTGRVSRARVAALSALARAASPPLAAALV
jgi:(5-formylfuran-3-yl)methyl phosphate synthase